MSEKQVIQKFIKDLNSGKFDKMAFKILLDNQKKGDDKDAIDE